MVGKGHETGCGQEGDKELPHRERNIQKLVIKDMQM